MTLADPAADQRDELRDVARRVLGKESSSGRVRAVMQDGVGYDAHLWQTMADLGWTGLEIPEVYGGAGQGFAEVGVILQELGRFVTPGPFFSTVVLGVGALLAAGTQEQRRQLLPGIAAGDVRVAVVTPPPADPSGFVVARADRGDHVLSGTTPHVLDAGVADMLVVFARSVDGSTRTHAFLVPASTPGVTHQVRRTLDMTRRLGEVVFDGVRAGADARLDGMDGDELLRRLVDRAAAGLACDSVGGARRVMEMTVDYAKVREQFGRPIGTFQAIKHRCADMLVLVETAQVAAEEAALEVSAAPGTVGRATAIAKWYACDAYAEVAGDGIQLHGGIGFTWEHDVHLFFKRAKLNQALFGSSVWHRARLADFVLPRPSVAT